MVPIAASARPLDSTSAKSASRRSRWRPAAFGEGLAAPRANLDLGVDQLAAHRRCQHGVGLAASNSSGKRCSSSSVSGLTIANSSSTDQEVGRLLERLANTLQVEAGVLRLGIDCHSRS